MRKLFQPHILIFEPRVEGHHLSWLRYITEDLLGNGFRLTLAVDYRPQAKGMIEDALAHLRKSIDIMSVFDTEGKWRGGSKIKALAECFAASKTHEVFMNNFDEIASSCLRFAALGILPPKILQGRLNGVYFRPRFLANSFWPVGNIIKAFGFWRLCNQQWFKRIYLLDEYLSEGAAKKYRDVDFYFLPDPWSGNFTHDRLEARNRLDISSDKFVVLNYGIGTRRKGLHVIIRSLLDAPPPDRQLLLLCAGKVTHDRGLLEGLEELEKRGIAKVLNRYVSDEEEELCFCASDAVVLPYIKHFGSSGVLARAAAAGKLVIASDEGLLSKRVMTHHLGLLFRSGDSKSLQHSLEKAHIMKDAEISEYRAAALRYASLCSRESFRKAILNSFLPGSIRENVYVKGNGLQKDNLRSILLIQLGDIGDVVYTFPSARALKEAFPDAAIVMAVQKKAAGLVYACRWVDDVITIDKEKRSLWQEITYQKKFWQRVRGFRFDLAIDLRTGSRGAILAYLSRAKQRIGRYTYVGIFWRKRLFTHLVKPLGKMNQSIAEYYLDTIAAYGITTENLNPEISPTKEKADEVAKLLQEENVPADKPILAIQPFSLWQYKEWGAEKFVDLIAQLSKEFDITFVITGSLDERHRAQEIVDRCGQNVFNFAGKTSLETLPALLQACTLFLGVDSAGVHIAAAVGTPTISLYGPSAADTWAPKGSGHRVVTKGFLCLPCKETGCQGSMRSRCMEELTVEEVFPAVRQKIKTILQNG
ncbi:MAG TPA: glycosyltransferase [Deltaproteobacteria bacterium]|nr:glycosyltransferase [Deltaproteobacteria bacterium]